jgi:hypothetical protein
VGCRDQGQGQGAERPEAGWADVGFLDAKGVLELRGGLYQWGICEGGGRGLPLNLEGMLTSLELRPILVCANQKFLPFSAAQFVLV